MGKKDKTYAIVEFHSGVYSFPFPPPILFQPIIPFHAQDGETTVLAGFGKAEEDGPEQTFGGSADGE